MISFQLRYHWHAFLFFILTHSCSLFVLIRVFHSRSFALKRTGPHFSRRGPVTVSLDSADCIIRVSRGWCLHQPLYFSMANFMTVFTSHHYHYTTLVFFFSLCLFSLSSFSETSNFISCPMVTSPNSEFILMGIVPLPALPE